MTFFKRMFSADFRRGVAAEAAGDYAEAARAYALAGERIKVAEMHLLRAERAPSPAAKLHELRAAIRWADGDDEDSRRTRRRIARSLFMWAKAATLIGDPEKAVVREAAQLFGDVSDFAGAGECHEFIGDELQAAECYQKAGDVDKLESVLAREEQRRKRESRVRDAFEEYRLAMAAGERDRALEAIRQCAESPLPALGSVTPEKQAELTRDRASYQRLREELEARLIADGTLTLRLGAAGQAKQRRFVGAFPLIMGRDVTCQLTLRDGGISRQHAEIALGDDGRLQLRDRGSKNGTTLGGVTIAGALPLGDDGEIGLGDLCALRYRVADEILHLEITRGLDRGIAITASPHAAMDVDGVGEVVFIDGRPRLSPVGGRLLYLNGKHAAGAVQLVRGDVIELGEARLEVA